MLARLRHIVQLLLLLLVLSLLLALETRGSHHTATVGEHVRIVLRRGLAVGLLLADERLLLRHVELLLLLLTLHGLSGGEGRTLARHLTLELGLGLLVVLDHHTGHAVVGRHVVHALVLRKWSLTHLLEVLLVFLLILLLGLIELGLGQSLILLLRDDTVLLVRAGAWLLVI